MLSFKIYKTQFKLNNNLLRGHILFLTMSYICNVCNASFTAEKYLTRHTRAKTCEKQYVCNKCQKEFTTAQNLRFHMKRKVPCVPDLLPVLNANSANNTCKFCGKTYANRFSLDRHTKICNMKNDSSLLINLALRQEMAELKKQMCILQQNQQPIIVNNNNINIDNSQNMYVNVTICSFGSEDLTKLDQQGVIDLLKGQVEDFMPRMIEYIHANPKHPEFHNVFYDPVRKKALVFRQNQDKQLTWQFEDIDHVSKLLTNKIKDHIHPLNGPYFNSLAKEDTETANKIPQILCMNWGTPEIVEGTKSSLSKVTQNEGFMDQVSIME